MNIVSDNMLMVTDKINAEIDRRGDTLASILKEETNSGMFR